MLDNVNWWLWASLLPVYYIYEYIGTKNTIDTNKLKAISASNTGVLMYIIGIVGTYICVTEGLINLIPITAGAWLGTYHSVQAEVKANEKTKEYETSKNFGVGQSPKENEKGKGHRIKTRKKVYVSTSKGKTKKSKTRKG